MDKSRPKPEQKLVDWAKPYLSSSRRLRYIMDPRLADQYSVKGSREAAALALQCISANPKDRPKMSQVVETLEGLQHMKDMAASSGLWPITPKDGRNGGAAKSKLDGSANGSRRTISATAKLA